jgi:DNA polymerase III epsilon subunit-like protein
MTRICFIDTETTSLRPDRRAWEIGIIVRDPGRDDVEYRWLIGTGDLDLGNADPFALKVGRFYERHPQMNGEADGWGKTENEGDALRHVEAVTRGAHLVGAVVSFDAEVLGTRMRSLGICPSWHYHLIDVEPLAVGRLTFEAGYYETKGEKATAKALSDAAAPPWKSDELSKALGIVPDESARHTALGDARWARAIYDAVMGGAA